MALYELHSEEEGRSLGESPTIVDGETVARSVARYVGDAVSLSGGVGRSWWRRLGPVLRRVGYR
jgi:hypothetical protein